MKRIGISGSFAPLYYYGTRIRALAAGGAEGGREKREREGSIKQAKNKKLKGDLEEGGPSAFDSMD